LWEYTKEKFTPKSGIGGGILSEEPVWVKLCPCVGYIKGKFYAVGLTLNHFPFEIW